MSDVYCSKCDIEFEWETWKPGECPCCHRKFYWDEFCTEDYSDCWAGVEWE